MWKMPEVSVGDRVLWIDNPFAASSVPMFGFVSSKPGSETIKCLVFTESHGFVEKMSVRHKDDPFWTNSELAQQWSQWGCWQLHPETKLIKDLKEVLDRKLSKAKETVAA